MADLENLVEDLSVLTVLEAAELSRMLEEKWGVSAAAPVAVAAMAAGAEAAVVEEKTSFDVILTVAGACRHQPRPQGSQGSGRGCAQARERRLVES